MKSIKNGDVVTFGDKIFLAVEGQLAMVVAITKKELKEVVLVKIQKIVIWLI